MIHVTVKFKKDLDLTKLSKSYKDAALRALQTSVLKVHSTAVRSIQKISSGGQVKRRGKTHTVSKPGDPPNVDTGRLIQSIQFQIDKLNALGVVGSNLKYAGFLEFGTRTMGARPWLKPAADKNRRFIATAFKREIRKRKKV